MKLVTVSAILLFDIAWVVAAHATAFAFNQGAAVLTKNTVRRVILRRVVVDSPAVRVDAGDWERVDEGKFSPVWVGDRVEDKDGFGFVVIPSLPKTSSVCVFVDDHWFS